MPDSPVEKTSVTFEQCGEMIANTFNRWSAKQYVNGFVPLTPYFAGVLFLSDLCNSEGTKENPFPYYWEDAPVSKALEFGNKLKKFAKELPEGSVLDPEYFLETFNVSYVMGIIPHRIHRFKVQFQTPNPELEAWGSAYFEQTVPEFLWSLTMMRNVYGLPRSAKSDSTGGGGNKGTQRPEPAQPQRQPAPTRPAAPANRPAAPRNAPQRSSAPRQTANAARNSQPTERTIPIYGVGARELLNKKNVPYTVYFFTDENGNEIKCYLMTFGDARQVYEQFRDLDLIDLDSMEFEAVYDIQLNGVLLSAGGKSSWVEFYV